MCASSTWASPRWTETADAELDAAATGAPTASTCIPSGPRAGGGSTGGVVTETSIKACPLSASCRSCSSLTNSPPTWRHKWRLFSAVVPVANPP